MVVYCKGVMYKLEVYDSHRRLLSPHALLKQFQWIIDDADNYQGNLLLAVTAYPASLASLFSLKSSSERVR